MLEHAVEAVRDRGADRAAGLIVRSEHEVVDHELRSPLEQFAERARSRSGLERVVLLDADPRQFLPQASQLVTPTGVFLLEGQELVAGRDPLVALDDLVL